jgi:hypothetical protein
MQQTSHGLANQVNDDLVTNSMSRENENMLRQKLRCRYIASHRIAARDRRRDATGTEMVREAWALLCVREGRAVEERRSSPLSLSEDTITILFMGVAQTD